MTPNKLLKRTIRCSGRTTRRGAALVEMAVVLPLLLLMLFGIMEFGWMFMAKETLTHAVREACRTRVLPGGTDAEARTRFAEVMGASSVRISADDLRIDPPILDPEDENKRVICVHVSVPYERVSLLGSITRFRLFNREGLAISASCSMRQEG